ncbi:MAG: Stk1 family PASTA domain-containing Ser/Thr kinase [Candidatus Eremiobacteraeota bacterium]|nr:Stk1 family PASTA domain-containing Ser/Thr kinase [Candidatus Eremiobacteraeota bacterium]
MVGKILKERYKILEKIGSGGMADVYKAEDQRLGRIVALKILKADYASDREFIHRFYREACSAAKLSHPNIVNVFDIEDDEGYRFIVMEYVEGQDLKSWMKKLKKPLNEESLVPIVLDILKALSFAHEKGIIHRDLKPHNILITRGSTVKVADFGIARALFSDTITQTGSMLGSVHYFSPEQAQGKPISAPSDLYSLGVLMFEASTGRLPFDADNPVSVALKHVQEAPPLPSSLNPSIAPRLERIIMKALQKDPHLRYQNAAEMAEDLERQAAPAASATKAPHPPPPPPPPPPPEPTLLMPPSKTRQELEEVSHHLRSRREDLGTDELGEPKDTAWQATFRTMRVLIFVLIALSLVTWAVVIGSKHLQEIETPDIVGKLYNEAQAIVEARGLTLMIQSEEFSEKPERTILDQKPRPGEKIRPGRTIYVQVSKGSPTAEMPDLVGVSLDRSKQILRDRGLTNIKIIQEFSDKVAENVIIAQEPAPQNIVSPSSKVILTVSRGPEKEKVPDLTGKTKEEAQKILSKIQVKLVVDSLEPNAQIPAQCIIRQDPSPGTLLVKDSTVKVVVSKGMEGLTSPNLVGKTIQEAQEIAEPLGISLKIEGDEKGLSAQITSQEPPAGEPIENKIITVRAESLTLAPDCIGKKLSDARALLGEKGFQVGEVISRETSEAPPDTVIEQDPQAGLEVSQGTKVKLVVAKALTAPQSTPPLTATPAPSPEGAPAPSPTVK